MDSDDRTNYNKKLIQQVIEETHMVSYSNEMYMPEIYKRICKALEQKNRKKGLVVEIFVGEGIGIKE